MARMQRGTWEKAKSLLARAKAKDSGNCYLSLKLLYLEHHMENSIVPTVNLLKYIDVVMEMGKYLIDVGHNKQEVATVLKIYNEEPDVDDIYSYWEDVMGD